MLTKIYLLGHQNSCHHQDINPSLTKSLLKKLLKLIFAKKFKNYKMLYIMHKNLTNEMLENEWELASWNFVAEKS